MCVCVGGGGVDKGGRLINNHFSSFILFCNNSQKKWLTLLSHTVKILKFGTPQTIAIIVLKIEKFDVTLH